jgi:hypothetical protein
MKYTSVVLIVCLIEGLSTPLFGQGSQMMEDFGYNEEVFRASTKQVNQFFRRFNGEEDPDGKRYLPSDRKYRDFKVRKEYLPLLIDPTVYRGNRSQIQDFSDHVNDRKNPIFLDNHKDEWLAEVACEFLWNGKPIGVVLLMKLQPQGEGYEWIIDDISSDAFAQKFNKDEGKEKPFIHPMSHELDFMNLKKAFEKGQPESFTQNGFKPDLLSVFLFELNTNELYFKSVQSLRFHFFSIPGWYFEISEYNRPGMPSGWLISNLVKVTDDQKLQLKEYVYGR